MALVRFTNSFHACTILPGILNSLMKQSLHEYIVFSADVNPGLL